MRCAQSSLDRVCGVENRVLLRGRHACFGLTIVQMHGPSPPGWAWGSGPKGETSAYTGVDFIIARDGKIAALYVYLDLPPT
jgi:hypothetical protein